MLVNEDNYRVLEKASKETMTNYEIRWFNAEEIDGYIEPDSMFSIIEDLLCELENRDERIEEIIRDRNDNYRQITPKEMYEI